MRLIDADEFRKALRVFAIDNFNISDKYLETIATLEKVDDMLASTPTVEAEPVRHGRYIGEADGYADGELVYDIWSCSECGCHFEDWDEQPTYNFCPNCGAKMEAKNG